MERRVGAGVVAKERGHQKRREDRSERAERGERAEWVLWLIINILNLWHPTEKPGLSKSLMDTYLNQLSGLKELKWHLLD